MVSLEIGKNTIHAVNTTVVEIKHAHTQLESVETRLKLLLFYLASSQFDADNAFFDDMNANDTSVVESVVNFTETRRIKCNACYAGR